jgi:hypothetical protein
VQLVVLIQLLASIKETKDETTHLRPHPLILNIMLSGAQADLQIEEYVILDVYEYRKSEKYRITIGQADPTEINGRLKRQ